MSDIHAFNMPAKNASNDDWRDEPITDRQKKLIEDKGYEAPDTKGEASDLITEILRKEDPATEGQIRRLEFYGIYGDFSKKEASELIEKNKPLHDEEEYQKHKKTLEADAKRIEEGSTGCSKGCGCMILIFFAIIAWMIVRMF